MVAFIFSHLTKSFARTPNTEEVIKTSMAAMPTPTAAPRSFEDFVPSSEWVKEEGSDMLFIDLPGFKKEQLKVQLDNYGNLRTSGERPLEGSRWRRFRKEFRVPDYCNASEIRAKFENGVLVVTLPKLITHAEPPAPMQAPEPQPPMKPSEPVATEAGKGNVDKEGGSEEVGGSRVGGLVVGLREKRRKLMLNAVVAVVVLVGVGIYVSYKLRKSTVGGSGEQVLEYFEL